MHAMQNTGHTVSIRPVTEADAGDWIDLVNALADYEKLDRPTSEAVERLKTHALADVPKFTAWLAWLDDRPVGYCVFFETYSTFLAKPTLYLEDLFVHPEFRGAGIGRSLWNALESEVLLRDCGRMEWTCLHWNMLGIKFLVGATLALLLSGVRTAWSRSRSESGRGQGRKSLLAYPRMKAARSAIETVCCVWVASSRTDAV